MSENGHEQMLTPAQQSAMETFARSGDAGEAAASAGVSERTVRRWRALPLFQQTVRDVQREALLRISLKMLQLGESAVGAVEGGLNDPNTRVRLRAAEILFSRLLEWRELLDIEDRLEALEKRPFD